MVHLFTLAGVWLSEWLTQKWDFLHHRWVQMGRVNLIGLWEGISTEFLFWPPSLEQDNSVTFYTWNN